MSSIIAFIKGHLTSVSSLAAVVLTVLGTLLASGIVGPGTTLYQVVGGMVSVFTVLGVKPLPTTPTVPPVTKA